MARQKTNSMLSLLARELVFRTVCRHRQGEQPNILLYCMPRSGSTWILNTVAAHPGMRYVGRPFMTATRSRWRGAIPDLGQTAQDTTGHRFLHFIHFKGDALARFERFARRVIEAQWHIYPTLHFRSPYFNRCTSRVIFQVHTIMPMIEWFDATFHVETVILLRHPIPNALSLTRANWLDEAADYLHHQWFVETYLSGPQVDLGREVLRTGSPIERHVLDWCLRMLVPIRAIDSGRHPDWLVLTYEQMVREPELVVQLLCKRLDLPDAEAMMRQARRPSRTVSAGTMDRIGDHQYLLSRWQAKIKTSEERTIMRIPAAFEIDVYEPGRVMPAERILHQS